MATDIWPTTGLSIAKNDFVGVLSFLLGLQGHPECKSAQIPSEC